MKKLHKIEVERLENRFSCVCSRNIDYSSTVTDQDMFIIKLCLYYCVFFDYYSSSTFYHPSPGIDQVNCYDYSNCDIGPNDPIGSASIYKEPDGYLFIDICLKRE